VPEIPPDALLPTPKIEAFCWRIEQSHVRDGGFALVTGDSGTGKSVVLRLLAERLARVRDLTVGVIAHPQSHVADFYRELGDVFGVALKPHNRWNGFKTLREQWAAHLESTLLRPVLLIDEAQEMPALVLLSWSGISRWVSDSSEAIRAASRPTSNAAYRTACPWSRISQATAPSAWRAR
jgi:hypothetical protein